MERHSPMRQRDLMGSHHSELDDVDVVHRDQHAMEEIGCLVEEGFDSLRSVNDYQRDRPIV